MMSFTNPAAPPSPTPPKYLSNKKSVNPDDPKLIFAFQNKVVSRAKPVLNILDAVCNGVSKTGLVVHEITKLLLKSSDAAVADMNESSSAPLASKPTASSTFRQ